MRRKNIDNLTSLWETAGKSFNTFFQFHDFALSIAKDSDWPNKIWFMNDITEHSLSRVIDKINENSINFSIPYWDIYESGSSGILEDHGFTLKSEQVGMSMKLNKKFEYEKRLKIIEITNEADSGVFEFIYPLAFRYRISQDTIINTRGNIKFYLALADEKPVGTAILYKTGDTAGIHGVGIIPEARRKGFAEEIMKYLLNESILLGAKYSTLQASNMGKAIYLRLGYSEDFILKNYLFPESGKEKKQS